MIFVGQFTILVIALIISSSLSQNNFNNNGNRFVNNRQNNRFNNQPGNNFNNNNRFNNQPANNFDNNNNRFNNRPSNNFNNNRPSNNFNNNRFNNPQNGNNLNNNRNRFNNVPRNNFNNNRFNNQRPQNNANRFNNQRPGNTNFNNNGNRFNARPSNNLPRQPRVTPSNALDNLGNEVYPGCNGTVCLPIASLCSIRTQKAGHFAFRGQNYWVSWASDEPKLRNARWNWFTGRNYCRKMCMDMVSFERADEQEFIVRLMRDSQVRDIHTAGRLCDKEVDGCDQARFQPLNINGWFWASTLQMMPPTNVRNNKIFNDWSHTGPNGKFQPDGTLNSNGFGLEACMALNDNKYNDGPAWHDEPCNTRRVIVCEDLPIPNINFVRNNNPGFNIP